MMKMINYDMDNETNSILVDFMFANKIFKELTFF